MKLIGWTRWRGSPWSGWGRSRWGPLGFRRGFQQRERPWRWTHPVDRKQEKNKVRKTLNLQRTERKPDPTWWRWIKIPCHFISSSSKVGLRHWPPWCRTRCPSSGRRWPWQQTWRWTASWPWWRRHRATAPSAGGRGGDLKEKQLKKHFF